MGTNYAMGLYEKAIPGTLGWEEKLTCARDAGYDFFEISIDETDAKLARLDMTVEECMELAALSQRIGVPIRSMCLSGHRRYPLGSHDADVRQKSLEIMEKAILFAGRLGIRVIMLAGYDVYYEQSDAQTRLWFEENLKRAVQMAAKAGVILAFETMETEFMNTTAKAMAYVNSVGNGYLGVYPDTGNITNAAVQYSSDVTDDLRSGAGHLYGMHLKESKPGVFREVPYGTGHVDFVGAVKAAHELGIHRFVTEFWYTGSPTWKEELSQTCGSFRAMLDREFE